MSVIYGVCHFDGHMAEDSELQLAKSNLDRFPHDYTAKHTRGPLSAGIGVLVASGTSTHENPIATDEIDGVVILDGRIDNASELTSSLTLKREQDSVSNIILAGFRRWGTGVFAHLVGEWAIALFDASDATIYLARDHAGTRPLYFRLDGTRVAWSSELEGLSRLGRSLDVSVEYVTGYISGSPPLEHSPFQQIVPVLPGHYVTVRQGTAVQTRHWDPFRNAKMYDPGGNGYDEEFVHLLRQSVSRRIQTGTNIVAELSGGLDSSSVVCLADSIRSANNDPRGLIDTLSYFDDSEPNWDERPYFSLIEKRRGKIGFHIDLSQVVPRFVTIAGTTVHPLAPGHDDTSFRLEEYTAKIMGSSRPDVVISGCGGDELLGGVPNAIPELADYLVKGQFRRYLSSSLAWSIQSRSNLMTLTRRTLRLLLDLYPRAFDAGLKNPPWIRSGLPTGFGNWKSRGRLERLTISPSRLCTEDSWWMTVSTLPHLVPGLLSPVEYRYPYLDRDLVEFLIGVPRQELLGPGQRRRLMRRALRNIVPSEILDRQRKAYVLHRVLYYIRDFQEEICSLFSQSLAAEYGFIEPDIFLTTLRQNLDGEPRWLLAIVRTLNLELWLRSLNGFVAAPTRHEPRLSRALGIEGHKLHARRIDV